MNVKPLMKHFPEIHHLPIEEQYQLMQRAHQLAFGPDNKLRIWRKNIIGLGFLLLASVTLIAIIGPFFKLAASTTGILMMGIIFPLFVIIQQRRYITQLRLAVQKILRG